MPHTEEYLNSKWNTDLNVKENVKAFRRKYRKNDYIRKGFLKLKSNINIFKFNYTKLQLPSDKTKNKKHKKPTIKSTDKPESGSRNL